MSNQLKHFPPEPKIPHLLNSFYILRSTHEAASSFLDIFQTSRKTRRAKGAPTDKEQDLLRAMLIFAASGLDSMVKQLIHDTLREVINVDRGATEQFKVYIERRIRKGGELDYKFLASVIAENEPRNLMVTDLIIFLRSSSLQSKDQLLKVAAFFNIPSAQLSSNFRILDEIFEARNQIAHEMDIDFTQARKNRRPRRQDQMISYANEIFRFANSFLKQVESKLE
ncbi:MAG: HEPN domain-containing protein [Pyrinomonadaceae bacterium]